MDTDGHRSEEEEMADDLTGAVIGAAFEVANVLGSGFLERVYERALMRELALRGIGAKSQVSFPVLYKERYVSDVVVQEKLIVELKCVDRFSNEHIAQCVNYLKASHLEVALLINFQKPRVEWKRIIQDGKPTLGPQCQTKPNRRRGANRGAFALSWNWDDFIVRRPVPRGSPASLGMTLERNKHKGRMVRSSGNVFADLGLRDAGTKR